MTTEQKTNVELIKKQIKSIKGRGKQLDKDIQAAAVNIAEHVKVHHETSLINSLVDAMPKGSRVNALRTWFESCAKCIYDAEEKVFIPSRDDAPELPDGYPIWTDFKPEPEFKPFDLNKKIEDLLKQARKASESERADEHNIPADVLTGLSSLLETK